MKEFLAMVAAAGNEVPVTGMVKPPQTFRHDWTFVAGIEVKGVGILEDPPFAESAKIKSALSAKDGAPSLP